MTDVDATSAVAGLADLPYAPTTPGRYCWRGSLKKSVCFGYDPLLIEMGRLTLASLLRQLDFNTAVIGKWLLRG